MTPTPENHFTLWTVSYLYPPNYSGAGFQAHREHIRFVRRGVSVKVLAAGDAGPRTDELEDVSIVRFPAIAGSLPAIAKRSQAVAKLWSYILDNLRSFSFAAQCTWSILAQGRRNDIVRFEVPSPYTFIPLLAARGKGMKTILRMHMYGSDDPVSILSRVKRGRLPEALTLLSFHLSDAVVPICTAMLESCRKTHIAERKLKLIRHGSDTERYQPVDDTERTRLCRLLGMSPEKRYILFVGETIERKGIDILTDAFILLHAHMPDVELLIVGPHEFKQQGILEEATAAAKTAMVEQCKQAMTRAGCGDAVHWVGRVENAWDYMKIASLYCFPTRREGLPLVVIEALASGLPVVISRLEGITTDLVTPDTGTIVDTFRSEDYANAMETILANPAHTAQMRRASRQRALSEFSLDGAVEAWLELVNELLRSGPRSDQPV